MTLQRTKQLTVLIFSFIMVLHSFSAFAKTVAHPAKSFSVAPCFGDNMVLQQNEPIRIWGTSKDESGIVTAVMDGSIGTAEVKNGAWMIELAARCRSSEEHTIEIFGGDDCQYVSFEHITIGDVWLFMGQSNMEYTASNSPSFESFASTIRGDEEIRILHVMRDGFKNNTRWRSFSKYSSYDASALGVFTAKSISDGVKNEIPIGIVSLGYAGMDIKTFLPPEEKKQSANSDIYRNVLRYLEKMPIAGVVWYQGEADAPDYMAYPSKLEKLVNFMRDTKKQERYNFPFYLVELSPCFNDPNDSNRQYQDFGEVRGTAGMLGTKLKNFYICSTSDLWKNRQYSNNLHPANKEGIAKRLSHMILSKEYAFGGEQFFFSPLLKNIKYENDCKTVICEFDYVGDGLQSDGLIRGFTLINQDWNSIDNVKVEIVEKNKIKLSAQEDICIVRYGTKTDSVFGQDVSLCNSRKIPAAAFAVTLTPPNASSTAASTQKKSAFGMNKVVIKTTIYIFIIVGLFYFLRKVGRN